MLKRKIKAAPVVSESLKKYPILKELGNITELLQTMYHFSTEEINELLESGYDGLLAAWEVEHPGIVLLLMKNNGEDLHYFSHRLRDEDRFHKGEFDSIVKVMYGPSPNRIRKIMKPADREEPEVKKEHRMILKKTKKEDYTKEYSTMDGLLADYPFERNWEIINKMIKQGGTWRLSDRDIKEVAKQGYEGILAIWRVHTNSLIILGKTADKQKLRYSYINFRQDKLLHGGGFDKQVHVMYGPHPRQIRKLIDDRINPDS